MSRTKKAAVAAPIPDHCAEKLQTANDHLERNALEPALDILAPLFGCACQSDSDCSDPCDQTLTDITEPFQRKPAR